MLDHMMSVEQVVVRKHQPRIRIARTIRFHAMAARVEVTPRDDVLGRRGLKQQIPAGSRDGLIDLQNNMLG